MSNRSNAPKRGSVRRGSTRARKLELQLGRLQAHVIGRRHSDERTSSGSGSHVMYTIEVTQANGASSTTEQRYSAFAKLRSDLVGSIKLPFPGKKFHLSEKQLDQRQAALETFLQGVMAKYATLGPAQQLLISKFLGGGVMRNRQASWTHGNAQEAQAHLEEMGVILEAMGNTDGDIEKGAVEATAEVTAEATAKAAEPVRSDELEDQLEGVIMPATSPGGTVASGSDGDGSQKAPPLCPARLVLFCFNLLLGLVLSQVVPELMSTSQYNDYKHVIKVVTMFHLSYIMINVGFEFDIDKRHLRQYGKDYLVAMTAASFPWIFCSLWFMFALGEDHNMHWRMAFLAGRFAAPTSAGILFTMLEAAGMKETWLFKKARVLAIFDDLDTLLLMVPLKGIIVGAKWELSIDLIWVVLLLVIMYKYLHSVDIPATWYAVAAYAAGITFLCEMVHFATHSDAIDTQDVADTIHLEILLPAFTMGCIVEHPHDHDDSVAAGDHHKHPQLQRQSTFSRIKNMEQESFKFGISAVFMVLVGLSMPSLFNDEASAGGGHRRLEASTPSMPGNEIIVHVVVCSFLMNLGKLFPSFCYRDEVNLRTRIALAIGMMPRGEVCAGIIVNAIALGAEGPAVTIAVLCLAVNMTCVSGFIFTVKKLTSKGEMIAPKT